MSSLRKRARTPARKTRVLWVHGEDYAASTFQSTVRSADDFVRRQRADRLSETEREFDTEVLEFGAVDAAFIEFIRRDVQDHDQRKHQDFFLLTPASEPSKTDSDSSTA